MKVKEITGEIYCLTSVYPEGYPMGFSSKQQAYYDARAFCLYGGAWRILHPEAGEWEVVSQHRDNLTGSLFVDCKIPGGERMIVKEKFGRVRTQDLCIRLRDAVDRLMCLLVNNLDSEGMEDLAEIFFCASILARARRASYLEALSLELFDDINDWNLHVTGAWDLHITGGKAKNDTDSSR